MKINIDKIGKIEKLIIEVGRELNTKAVIFKDDIENMKNLQHCIENIIKIKKREMQDEK